MNLVKSKHRVADHGEVFTPAWLVEPMLDLVKDESARIDSRFLEPACGSGNLLVQVLPRKLAARRGQVRQGRVRRCPAGLCDGRLVAELPLGKRRGGEHDERCLVVLVRY